MLSLTGHSGHCDMTCSEHSSLRPLAQSKGENVILTVCGESNKYDKYNSDLFARAIHLKPQNLSYLNSWIVIVFCCVCVCVFVCRCVHVTIASTTGKYAVDVNMLKSL